MSLENSVRSKRSPCPLSCAGIRFRGVAGIQNEGGQLMTIVEAVRKTRCLFISQLMLLFALARDAGFAQGISSYLSALIKAERAFAAMSEKDGMKKAFLTYLADDGVIFQPGPVNGKSVWRTREGTTARLTWHPTLACVSSLGDLGFTSGPWVYTPEAYLDQPPRYGHFVSVWKKQRDGSWKVVADIGIRHDYPSGKDSLVVLPAPIPPKKKRSMQQERKLLLAAEQKLSAVASSEGVAAALARFLAEDARVYRDGMMPFVGRDNALDELRPADSKVSYRVLYSSLSRAYDLAYTYGSYVIAGESSGEGFFLRVWMRNEPGQWRLVVDVSTKAD